MTARRLSKVARGRLEESLRDVEFETKHGRAAAEEFLAIADQRVRKQSGRDPTRQALDDEVRGLAVERSLVFRDPPSQETVAERAQAMTRRLGREVRPEIAFALIYDSIKTGVLVLNDDGTFSVAKPISDIVERGRRRH